MSGLTLVVILTVMIIALAGVIWPELSVITS
jgi:hypothetical protein